MNRKTQTLEIWLANAGGRVPFEMALYVMEPVIRGLAVMHINGGSRLNIGMDSILVQKSGQAALAEDTRKAGAGTQALKPGFAAPEQYRTGGDIGPWCDVYAIAALLYRMVMGKPLPDAFSRLESDVDVQGDIAGRKIDEDKKSVWLRAISLKPEERFHNCGMLAMALYEPGEAPEKAESAPGSMQMQTTNAPWTAVQPLYGYAQGNSVKPEKKFKKRWIAVIAAGAFAIAAGGYYGYLETNYQQAVQFTEKKEYRQALDSLAKIPDNYRDSQSMDEYGNACLLLSQRNFDGAQDLFEKLGDYRDSRIMLTEVAYGRAKDKLEDAKYDDAKTAFVNLGDYKDAKDMALEADLRKAEDMINREQYLDAYKLLLTIEDYPEAKKEIERVLEDIYNNGVDLYRQKDYEDSHGFLTELPGDYKDTAKYLSLLDCLLGATQARCETLKSLAGFEDAVDIMMSNYYIGYFLAGTWIAQDGNYFEFVVASDGYGNARTSLPMLDGDFTISGGIYTVAGMDMLQFEYVDNNRIIIYCYINGTPYDMNRLS